MGSRADDEKWKRRAACVGSPTSWFFPEHVSDADADAEAAAFAARGIVVTKPSPRNDLKAKEICAQCPVARECIMTSVATNEDRGVWGVGGQRRRYLRKQWATLDSNQFSSVVDQEVRLLRNGYERIEVQPAGSCERCARRGITSRMAEGVRPEDVNGENARCGKAVTYARGCRCIPCKLAHSMRVTGRAASMAAARAARTVDTEDELQAHG